MIRVVLVDDHAMIRRGLRETLVEAGGIEVVGEAPDYPTLRDVLRRVDCDVAAAGCESPGRSGIEILQTLGEAYPDLRAIVMSQYPEDQYGVRAMKGGAMAYLEQGGRPLADRGAGGALRRRQGADSSRPRSRRRWSIPSRAGSGGALHDRLSEREMQTLIRIGARREALGDRRLRWCCRPRRSASTGRACSKSCR
jgi:DNA-binding NarL/FixJ family response regulator